MAGDELARDTIAAIATPPGRGGLGVVRVSGPLAQVVARALCGDVPSARRASLRRFHDAQGRLLDEGLALFFPGPRSYTGEDVLELHGHGGPVVVSELFKACLDAGARLAEPGEFTRRAFLSGKLDLAQAEAVADLIDAASREAARSALRSLEGEFSRAVNGLVEGLIELRALVEAMLDFPEEEVDSIHLEQAAARLDALRRTLEDLLEKSTQGSLLRTGIHVVIVGEPNVGKSSLLNRLAGVDRAIVTPVPGTTRDALREPVEIDGVPLVLVDTAGLRETADEVERLGMQRTREEAARAGVVLELFDATRPASNSNELPSGTPKLAVYNKADLVPGFQPPVGAILISAKTGQGIDALGKAITKAAGWHSAGESVFLARERHVRALRLARDHLHAANREIERWEFFAEELRAAQAALGTITGAVSADDLLGEIFSRFCIGK